MGVRFFACSTSSNMAYPLTGTPKEMSTQVDKLIEDNISVFITTEPKYGEFHYGGAATRLDWLEKMVEVYGSA